MPQSSDQSPASPTPFSTMSAQLYPDGSPSNATAQNEAGALRQYPDSPFDPVHDAFRQIFGIDSNQQQGGDHADKATGLVKDFAIRQAWKKGPLTFDEAKNTVLNHVVKSEADSGNSPGKIPAVVYTDMAGGKTWFHDPDTNQNLEIQTSNAVTRAAKRRDADSAYIGNITRCDIGQLGRAFGTAKIYTTDNRQRWIHGGGSGLTHPYAPQQGWKPTEGCTRGQNEDVENLCRRIQQWQTDNPDRPILYIRTRSIDP